MTYSTAALGIILVTLMSAAGAYLIRRFVPLETLKEYNEVGGLIFLQLGVIYSVLLSFVTITVWGQFNEASQSVEREAVELSTVFHLVSGFPEPRQKEIHQRMVEYVRLVSEEEWNEMKQGRESARTASAFDGIWRDLVNYKIQTPHENALYNEALHRLSNAREHRRIRIFQMNLSVPGIMWLLLVSVGMILVCISWFFGVFSLQSHMVLAVSLTITLAFILALIRMLDYPFSGDLVVSPEPFRSILKVMGETMGK